MFEGAASDVLLLLDCDLTISRAFEKRSASGTKETIATCGWEQRAPARSRWSFTIELVGVLDERIDNPVSAATLHSEMLRVINCGRPLGPMPIYLCGSAKPGIPSINLSRLPHAPARLLVQQAACPRWQSLNCCAKANTLEQNAYSDGRRTCTRCSEACSWVSIFIYPR